MVYSFYPGTLADRTDVWRSRYAYQFEGFVIMIRPVALELEDFLKKTATICRWAGVFGFYRLA